MRYCGSCACVAIVLAGFAFAQQPATKAKTSPGKESSRTSTQPDVKDILEAKVRAGWEAFKKKDKKAYRDLLADDFEGVENDGEGTRSKTHTVNEIDAGNVYNYLLFGIKVMPLGQDAAFITYEVTLEFPPKAQIRYSRVYVSELWLKRDGQWRERHYQETHVK